MWIINQNCSIIANSDTMQIIATKDNSLYLFRDKEVHELLGQYSSKDKADKVFSQLITAKGLNNQIFCMPKDEEVSV